MGTVSGRIIGNLKGKVGTMIFSKWRKLYVAKGLHRYKKKKKNLVLSPQQLKVELLTKLLHHFSDAIKIGFNKKNNKNAAWQLALRYNLTNAITGEYPDYEVNYKKLKISDGNLEGAWAAKIHAEPGCVMRISWQMSAMSEGTITEKDRTYLMMHSSNLRKEDIKIEIGTRNVLGYNFNSSPVRAGQIWHAWIFFISPDGKNVSNSDYCGSVALFI